jgi:SAM-dependent methyltransferase
MLRLIEALPAGSRVLDLGARAGSFETRRSDLCIVRLDLEPPAGWASGAYVRADARRMPFRAASFDVIISNHSLEHFVALRETIGEIGRVIKPDGALYVAVPDASTLADRIYRWLGRGGGHVNPFYAPADVIGPIEWITGLRHRGTRLLYSSFSFLNANNFVTRPPRKIALFAFGNERFLAYFVWLLRAIDCRFGTRLSHYGWALYFGSAELAPGEEEWINVCVRCGAGHSEPFLRKSGSLAKGAAYRCPNCRGFNLLTRRAK